MPEDREQAALLRSFWSGAISFGLVRVPVHIYSSYRSRSASLRMVSKKGIPLSRKYYCPNKNKFVRWSELVRGYEVDKDKFVIVKDEELEELEPEKTHEIDLERFVNISEIDPVFFQNGYLLAPADSALKAYRLLAESIERTGKAGIASFVMRGKEYVVAIIAEDGILTAETLRYQDEIRKPDDIGLPEIKKASEKKVKLIKNFIEKNTQNEFNQNLLRDHFAEQLQAIIKKKLKSGKDIVPKEKIPRKSIKTEIIDLTEILEKQFKGPEKIVPKNLKEKNKSELYEMAQKLDIPGRSSMTKDELIKTIKKVS